jgi:UDP-glucose 4-epimerase
VDSLAGIPVLVTGGSGFIGSHLTRRLIREDAEVHVLTSTVSSVYPFRLYDVREKLSLHGANLTDAWALKQLLAEIRPRIVFHLGAYTHVGKSWSRVDECVQTNIQGTLNLLQNLDHSQLQRFIYTSTSEVYGDIPVPFREDCAVRPVSPYAVSKYAGEMFCRIMQSGRGWPIVMIRPFNAYGPWQSSDRVIPEIILKALRKERLLMTSGRQTREFNFVEDLAEGFLRAALAEGVDGEVLNLGGGQEIAMRDLALKILEMMGNPIEAEIGALPERPTEIWQMRSDSSKARDKLRLPAPTELTPGLRKTIDWYRHELEAGSTAFVA